MKLDNLESLRKTIRDLQYENKHLKKLLQSSNIPFEDGYNLNENIFDSSNYDPDQGGRIIEKYIDEDSAKKFYSMFWGRTDAFAKRGTKGWYYLQCSNRWTNLCPKNRGEEQICSKCNTIDTIHLTPRILLNHLQGNKTACSDVIGVYPLHQNMTCRFLVFDFDNHDSDNSNDWINEVNALRMVCNKNAIPHLVERSRSGKGAHLWIFFKSAIEASKARNFGTLLLDIGRNEVNIPSFKYYDRMFPTQDFTDYYGNLIALPLQGQALKIGNSAFVDENWNAYPDQWDVLLHHTKKLTEDEVDRFVILWLQELNNDSSLFNVDDVKRVKPWKRKENFRKSDVYGKVYITLSDGIYVDAINLAPKIKNQIRSLAAFDNPDFYKRERMGYKNFNNYSVIYLGKDIDGYIKLPRGVKDILIEKLEEANIDYEIIDEREQGRLVKASFNGDLRVGQDLAADKMLSYDNGVLSATTAFGKTVVCSYLISKRKVNTLILVHSKDLLDQWVRELNKFLSVDEQLPTYITKTGRQKTRDNIVGVLSGSKNTLNGIIDVAMVGSLYSKGKFNDLFNSYGMVIMDECHHCASKTSQEIMQNVNARYVYGVSATPKRSDSLEKIVYMMIGPIRHSYTAKQRAEVQGIEHFIYPRYTHIVDTTDARKDIYSAYTLISEDKTRNEMIVSDTLDAVNSGRTPVILTRFKSQAKMLYESLHDKLSNVFLLYGDNSDKQNQEIRKKLDLVNDNEQLVLIATGQKIGEGFDFARLDTLMLAAPVSFEGVLEQYVGRIQRDYPGKKDVIVYDYVDFRIKSFERMYSKRLKKYKRLGYIVVTNNITDKQFAHSIYNADNYTEVFEQDLLESRKSIVISSPDIVQEKLDRFIDITKSRIESGCKITVITQNPSNVKYGSSAYYYMMKKQMEQAGLYVIVKDEVNECFAVIDDDLVWHGGMNLLGRKDAYDNLMRINSNFVASELLEISLSTYLEYSNDD